MTNQEAQFTLNAYRPGGHDAGEPLFPHSVECMRLISGYMAAFGCTPAELRTMCTENPERLLKISVPA